MFPVEHNLCSIHTLVCGSALPLPSLARDHLIFYFFMLKYLISLLSSISCPNGIEMRCGTLVSGSDLPLPSYDHTHMTTTDQPTQQPNNPTTQQQINNNTTQRSTMK